MPNVNRFPQPEGSGSLIFAQKPLHSRRKSQSFFAQNKIKRTIKRNRLKIFILTIVILAGVFLLKRGNQESEAPALEPSAPIRFQSPQPVHSPSKNIQSLLQTEVQKLPGTYNIYIKDLKTNQTYSTREEQKIPSASIYKLAVMYKTYDSIEKGELKKNQNLSSGLTVKEALRLMITISDNTSALLLAEKLGWANINNFLKAEGIDGYNLMIKDYPLTTAKATGDILERIYKKTAISTQASEEMLELLLAQEKNDRIPLNLPLDVQVAHKTGELDNFRHDAGIVFGKKSDYIFVFLTETPVPEDAYGNIAKLTITMFGALEN